VCATVTCFGANGYGQLGLGDTRERGSNSTNSMSGETVNIGAGYTAKAISCGGNHVCVHRLPDNSLLCFGGNVYGQLGLGLSSTTYIGDDEVCIYYAIHTLIASTLMLPLTVTSTRLLPL
jgi:alpha-tubulin suppressor-like RCC1 family protein